MSFTKNPVFQYTVLSFLVVFLTSFFLILSLTGISDKYVLDSQAQIYFSRMIFFNILAGGIIFYVSLFLVFYNSYRKQKKINTQLSLTENRIIQLLSRLAELRDNETGNHIKRTSEYVMIVTENLRKYPVYKKYITQSYINDIVRSAPLHDIGKVGIPDNILLKPGKLTNDEYEIMKQHTLLGARVLIEEEKELEFNSFLKIGIQIARYHHENWDGTGYPDKLKGDEIPLSARIMTLVDVYDALRSKRPYKEPFSHEKAVEIIKEDSGRKFDPNIVDVFLELEKEFRLISGKF